MAVIVKYVVVSDGKEEMIFSTKKEAEAHDKMLDIAERLYAFLHAAELNIAEDTLEALTLFMAQHREHIGTILKGGRLKTPVGSAQHSGVTAGQEGRVSLVRAQEQQGIAKRSDHEAESCCLGVAALAPHSLPGAAKSSVLIPCLRARHYDALVTMAFASRRFLLRL